MNSEIKQYLRRLQENFRRFQARKISNRLISTYVGLGALPLIIVSIILISLTQNTVQTYIYQINKETARRASNEIYLFIKDPLTILKTITSTRELYEMDPFIQGNLINRVISENPIFQSMFVLNDSGLVTVTTRFGEEMRSFSHELFFQKGMRGEVYFSDVYFTPTRFPFLTIAEPIKRFNQVVGVAVAEIDLKSIWTLVDTITIGKSGFAFLLSEDGEVIAHSNREKVFEREDYSKYDFYRELKNNEQVMVTYEFDHEEQLLVYAPVPQLKWGIVVQQSQTEAFNLARRMQTNVIIFTALTIIVAVLVGILGVKRLTRPLLRLVQGVREYGGGNLEHRITMETHDELAELAREFNAMADSLQKNQKELRRMERLAALSRFASLVSHEIRNPLNSMNINMQILKRTIQQPALDKEKQVKYLDVISSEISRINDLVTNFLTIARPPELNLIRTDIHQVLEEVILLQKARAEAEDICIEMEFLSKAVTGMFDYNQLKQVFHNIIINALEAMHDSGTITVKTRIKKSGTADDEKWKVQIEFHDTGEGIPEETLREVFEFYHTTKRTGSGLGLAIAKQIIEGHKGNIYIDSAVGQGTRVYIELPIDAPDSSVGSGITEDKGGS